MLLHFYYICREMSYRDRKSVNWEKSLFEDKSLFKQPNIASRLGGIPLGGKKYNKKSLKKLGTIKFIPWLRISLIRGLWVYIIDTRLSCLGPFYLYTTFLSRSSSSASSLAISVEEVGLKIGFCLLRTSGDSRLSIKASNLPPLASRFFVFSPSSSRCCWLATDPREVSTESLSPLTASVEEETKRGMKKVPLDDGEDDDTRWSDASVGVER